MCNQLGKTELLICAPLTKEQLDKELEKGMEDIRAGRVYSADEVEAEIRSIHRFSLTHNRFGGIL